MAYNLWQRRHLLVYLTSYDFKRSLCDKNTVPLGDSRLSELIDKFADVKNEHQQRIAFEELRCHHLLDPADDELVKARSEFNAARYQRIDLDKYNVEDPDGVMRRKPRQLSDTTIAKDGARRAIGRLQHESEEAKAKALQELCSKEGTRELEMNPKAACRLCGVVFTRDKFKRRKLNDAALHGFHRRWSHPSMDAERARSKGGRYENSSLLCEGCNWLKEDSTRERAREMLANLS